jgi:hypothetical protein
VLGAHVSVRLLNARKKEELDSRASSIANIHLGAETGHFEYMSV